MNVEYIEKLLKEEETIKQISLSRTQFSHYITEFYFFRIFFEVLQKLAIYGSCEKSIHTHSIGNERVIIDYFVTLTEGKKILKAQYDHDQLLRDLQEYNIKSQNK